VKDGRGGPTQSLRGVPQFTEHQLLHTPAKDWFRWMVHADRKGRRRKIDLLCRHVWMENIRVDPIFGCTDAELGRQYGRW